MDALIGLLALRGPDAEVFAQTLALAVLLCARLAALAWLVPWLAARGAPLSVSLAVTLVLALCLWPTAVSLAPSLPHAGLPLLLLLLREALIGLVYALTLALPLRVFEWAGELAGRFSGAPGADAAYGALQLWLGVAAFFALGGHRLVIAALVSAIVQRPVGLPSALHDVRGVTLESAHLFGDAFASAVLIALPVAAALALADLALALTARAAAAASLPLALAPARPLLVLVVIWISVLLLCSAMPEAFEQSLRAARRVWLLL